jgi:multidrug efflux pump subunit AcrA (membrane-fusion protein)
MERKIELVGTLEGQQEVTTSSEVAARVVAIHADLGDRVKRGQVLVELNPAELQMAVNRQRAALAQVLAQLGLTRETDPMPDPAQTSMVRKASADLADAKANFDRTSALVAKNVLSKQLYDASEARYRVAQANYTAALEAVRNLEAQVENMRAQLALAEKKVSDCMIRAPFAGTVAKRLVEIGQYVKEQTPVMAIVNTNPLKLIANVPERWYPYVAAGAPVELRVEAFTETFKGRVARISGAIDPQSRTFAIEAQLDNSKDQLRPGLFATATLFTSKLDSVLRVPANAVISFYGVQKVYAIENNEIKEVVVKLGDRSGDQIEVTEGLAPGTWIATSELTRIRQGTRVQAKREG